MWDNFYPPRASQKSNSYPFNIVCTRHNWEVWCIGLCATGIRPIVPYIVYYRRHTPTYNTYVVIWHSQHVLCRNDTLTQGRVNVDPTLTTLAQHWDNIGWMCPDCRNCMFIHLYCQLFKYYCTASNEFKIMPPFKYRNTALNEFEITPHFDTWAFIIYNWRLAQIFAHKMLLSTFMFVKMYSEIAPLAMKGSVNSVTCPWLYQPNMTLLVLI